MLPYLSKSYAKAAEKREKSLKCGFNYLFYKELLNLYFYLTRDNLGQREGTSNFFIKNKLNTYMNTYIYVVNNKLRYIVVVNANLTYIIVINT